MNVDDQLFHLASLAEEERDRLKALIFNCLKESEYLIADHHQKALNRIESLLSKLNSFADPHYDEKAHRLNMIQYYKVMASEQEHPKIKEYYHNQIEQEKAILEELSRKTEQLGKSEIVQVFEPALQRLLLGQIKNLQFIISKEKNLLLKFSYSKKVLKLSLPDISRLLKDRVVYDYQLVLLGNFGFEYTKGKHRMVLTVSGSKEIVAEKLRVVVARILFDVFNYKEFTGQSYISFTENQRDDK